MYIQHENYATWPTSNPLCQSCKYYNSSIHCCDYLERTGKLRRCPAENCAKWEKATEQYTLDPGEFLIF